MTFLKLHNIHPYHAKFYPGIPQYFLDKYAIKNSVVLDPFCGSGTTLLECNAKGIKSYGIDISFLSAKISRSKTEIYDEEILKDTIAFVLNSTDNTPIPFQDNTAWFTAQNYEQLCILYNAIKKIEETKYREILEVALSSLLNKICNKRNTWNLGYMSDNILPNKESRILLRNEFEKKCKWLLSAIKETNNLTNLATVYCGSSGKIKIDEVVDVVITSPPYPFAVDFARNNRLSYYLFEEDIEEATIAETGARNKRNKKNCESAFFEEMSDIYLNIMSQVKVGGYFCMTVSDTKRNNQQINFVDWLIHLFESNNWSIVEDNMRALEHQSMGQKRITEEHLLVLKKMK